ncbi:MAG: HD domain-containing phosphohydrolase, partial [Vicinamibacterales bacterium]
MTRQPRILVVDDAEEQVRLLRRVLTGEGYSCYAVANGTDAFAACLSFAPDVVLLDVQLPGADGFTVCRQLKAAEATCLTPVLMMTGMADHEEYLKALEAGADDFLAKPIRLAELRARVRSAARMKQYVDELDNAAASIVLLGATIEARDRSTEGHCRRLAVYASQLGARIGLGAEDQRALERGGYLHDLGKIAVPDAVLFKPGPLTVAEFEMVKTHPVVGDRLCAPLRTLQRVRPIIRSHHETLDGRGYPDGLAGSAVPLLAQIAAIADVYDALTSVRPYRPARTQAAAHQTLRDEAVAGKRDVALVDEFIVMTAGDASTPVEAGEPAADLSASDDQPTLKVG